MIILREKMINNDDINSDEFVTYLGLLMILRKEETEYFITAEQIAYLLTKSYPTKHTLEGKIILGIEGLVSKGFIEYCKVTNNNGKLINQKGKDKWLLDLSGMVKDNQVREREDIIKTENFYTIINKEDIYKILNLSNYYTRSISLLRFYSYVLTTIFRTGEHKGVGFTSLGNMSLETGISTRTLSSYLDTLVENKILHVYKSSDFIKFNTGRFIEISHTYGKYKNKDYINYRGKQHDVEFCNRLNGRYKKVRKPKNKTRSYVQKYIHVKKTIEETGEVPYENNEMKDIYEFIKELNKKQEGIKGKKPYSLDIFSSFDFYKE